MAADNNLLAEYTLTGIPKNLKGEEEVFVTFDVDTNGILHTTATSKSSNST